MRHRPSNVTTDSAGGPRRRSGVALGLTYPRDLVASGVVAIRFVGREAELSVLRALVESARSGAGGSIFVEGEAGVGKTRLVDELIGGLDRGRVRVLAAAAEELDSGRPFHPVSEALAIASEIHDDDPDRPTAAEDRGAAWPASAATDLSFSIAEALAAAVEEIAAREPCVVVVEDLHWADAGTLGVVRALGRAACRSSIALVLTARPFPRSVELGRTVDALASAGGDLLSVGPLGPEQAMALARAAAGAGAVSETHVAAAGGNPLLIVELAMALAEDPDLGPAMALSVRSAVLRRLRGLPAPTVDVLKVASVLGRRFRPDHLAALTGLDPVQLVPVLENALAAQVLGDEDGELAFRHQLIRDVIYDELAPALRQAVHRQAAGALTDFGASPLEVAEHLVAGAGPGDREAVGWLAAAAAAAAPRSPGGAVRLLEHARRLSRDPLEGDRLAAELAPLLVQVGRSAAAATLSRDVLARDPEPEIQALLRRGLGEVLWTKGWLEPAVAELEAAAAVVGAPEQARAEANGLADHLRVYLGEPGTEAGDAPAPGEAGGGFAECVTLQTQALRAAARADQSEAVDFAARAVSVAVGCRDPRIGLLHPHLTLGLVLVDGDRFEEAEAALQEGRRRAETRGALAWLPIHHCVLALVRLLAGDWDDGLAEVEAGLGLAEEVGTRLYVPFLHGMAGWVGIQRGDLDGAQASMDAAVREFLEATTSSWQAEASRDFAAADARWPLEWGQWINAHLHEARGDAQQALGDLESAWSLAAPLRYFMGYRLFGPDLVRLAVAAGNRLLAEAVCEEVAEGARRSGAVGAEAAALRCRGLLEGDGDALAAAAEAFRSCRRTTEAAFAAAEAGTALAAGGRSDDAVEHLEQAWRFFEEVGAQWPRDRTEAALRRLGVRHRRSGPGSVRLGWDSLTPTELRIARLAADGLTNRQIGQRLFISGRTVETHLGHVFAKLGLATRAQLAAEVARRA